MQFILIIPSRLLSLLSSLNTNKRKKKNQNLKKNQIESYGESLLSVSLVNCISIFFSDAKAAEAAQSAYYDPNKPQMAYVPPPAYYVSIEKQVFIANYRLFLFYRKTHPLTIKQ